MACRRCAPAGYRLEGVATAAGNRTEDALADEIEVTCVLEDGAAGDHTELLALQTEPADQAVEAVVNIS